MYINFFFLLLSTFFNLILSESITKCPDYFYNNGYFNDLGLLADKVSSDNEYFINGICGNYNMTNTYEGKYTTRLRIYSNNNITYLVFRPTQMYDQSIHEDKHLVQCTFIDNCIGNVQSRMQEAFISITNQITPDVINTLYNKTIFVAGHSLGGILEQYMSIYLIEKYNIVPYASIGLAGPFTGDEKFTNTYYNNISKFWQVESMNINNPSEFDGTILGYNVDYGSKIYIDYKRICNLEINPLPIDYSKPNDPHFSYGMHDLKNYRLALIGTNCTN